MTAPVGVRRGIGCGQGGLHWLTPDPAGVARCPCGTVTRVPATGRYCMPRDEHGYGICYCGRCPHYVALPEVDSREYRELVRASLRKAAEKTRKKNERNWGRR